uniref:Fucosyltransferase n=1 Tax=Eucampia antarctica TaxID=49252 RepID=A0A7S2SJN3_9STRA|mmetsp:Transcript_926/g.846  ORF Transcript_926/g.846 Transcript_926/m.846 type:complete len:443 (+) Transcript_926:38-1366(+)
MSGTSSMARRRGPATAIACTTEQDRDVIDGSDQFFGSRRRVAKGERVAKGGVDVKRIKPTWSSCSFLILFFLLAADVILRLGGVNWFGEPASLFRMYGIINRKNGAGDYENIVLRNFLEDFSAECRLDPPITHTPSKIARFVDGAIPPFLRSSSHPRRPAFWNDEVHLEHNLRSTAVDLPFNSVYFEGAPDLHGRMNNACAPIHHGGTVHCFNITIAAMSLFLREDRPRLEDRLRLPRATSPAAVAAWRADRSGFASYLYGRARPHRETFRAALAAAGLPFAGGGSAFEIPITQTAQEFDRDTVGIFDNATTAMEGYRFAITMEGYISSDYVSEKLVNAFLGGTIPVYYGTKDVSKFFNPRAFIDMRDFPSFEAAAVYVHEVDNNDTLALQYLREPPCTKENLEHLLWWRYEENKDETGACASSQMPKEGDFVLSEVFVNPN